MTQIADNPPEKVMLVDFPKAVDGAVMGRNEAQKNLMMQLLSDPSKAAGFACVGFELFKSVE